MHVAGLHEPVHAVALAQAPVEIGAARVRAVGQRAQTVRPPVHRRADDTDIRLVRELATHARDGIAGERLHGLPRQEATSQDVGELLLRDGVHHADRVPAHAARQLRRAENRRLRRRVGVRRIVDRQIAGGLRRTADAPGVEQVVAAVVAVGVEAKVAGTLDEEGAPLREERLEGRQVDDGRVGLDLTEVRVDGRRERQAGGEGVLHVEAERGVWRRRAQKRIAADGLSRQVPPRHTASTPNASASRPSSVQPARRTTKHSRSRCEPTAATSRSRSAG